MAGSSHHSQPALVAPFFSQRGLGRGGNLGPWFQGKVRIINFIGIETSGIKGLGYFIPTQIVVVWNWHILMHPGMLHPPSCPDTVTDFSICNTSLPLSLGKELQDQLFQVFCSIEPEKCTNSLKSFQHFLPLIQFLVQPLSCYCIFVTF